MRSITKNSKGQINIIVPSVLALVLAAVVLIFSLLMMDEIYNDTDDTTTTKVNQTITAVSHAAKALVGNGDCLAAQFSVSACVNATSGTVVPSTNYTVSATAGTILYKTAQGDVSGFNSSNWNCTYTYVHGDEACMAANDSIVNIGKIGDYFDLIVLAVIVAIIIGVMLAAFAIRGKNQ